jgi:hypothetical protein
MSLLKSKGVRRIATGFSALTLVFAAAIPTLALGESAPAIKLHRECPTNKDGGDPSCGFSNVQVAKTSATQSATQEAEMEATVKNTQSNDVDQTATNRNKAWASTSNDQEQKAVQLGGELSNDQSNKQDVDSRASTSAEGGATIAKGPVANVSFNLSQSSDASAHGKATAFNVTGNAGGDAWASGPVTTTGGNASARSEAEGGKSNGNVSGTSMAKLSDSANATSWLDISAGDGGDARAKGGDATGNGGEGGDGGKASNGHNGNDAEATSIAASIAKAIADGDDDPIAHAKSGWAKAGDASTSADSGGSSGGKGGAGGSGDATTGTQDTSAGKGGNANDNSNRLDPTATNTAGDVTGKSSGNNGNATSAAWGGDAHAGGSNGNVARGGDGSSGHNDTLAAVTGGTSQNFLSVGFTQKSGPTTAKGGSVTNSGSATSDPNTSASNTGTNTAPQTQNTTQKGTAGAITQDLDATSKQVSDPSNSADNRISNSLTQRVKGDQSPSVTLNTPEP